MLPLVLPGSTLTSQKQSSSDDMRMRASMVISKAWLETSCKQVEQQPHPQGLLTAEYGEYIHYSWFLSCLYGLRTLARKMRKGLVLDRRNSARPSSTSPAGCPT